MQIKTDEQGNYSEASILYINAIMRRLGCTVQEAIDYINKEDESSADEANES